MISSIQKQWFLLALVMVFLAVIFDPSGLLVTAGLAIKNHHGPDILIFIIFLFSGLIIETHQVSSGIRDVKSTALALFLVVLVSPLAALILGMIPLPSGVILGLFIVSVMPTTLSSGVVMTDKSGGNMAHALFVTILSNGVAVVSIPVILTLLLMRFDRQLALSIDQGAIVFKLVVVVLVPLFLGMGLKRFVFPVSTRWKKIFQVLNQWLVICIVFMSVSGVKQMLVTQIFPVIYISFLAAAFHLCLLLSAIGLTRLAGIGKGKRESVIFMGSQKTLPLSVMIQMTYFSEYGTALLVCVLHHVVHLMMDSYLCSKMAGSERPKKK